MCQVLPWVILQWVQLNCTINLQYKLLVAHPLCSQVRVHPSRVSATWKKTPLTMVKLYLVFPITSQYWYQKKGNHIYWVISAWTYGVLTITESSVLFPPLIRKKTAFQRWDGVCQIPTDRKRQSQNANPHLWWQSPCSFQESSSVFEDFFPMGVL